MKLSEFIFHALLALLFTHELDAVTQSEWRLLYVLRSMDDAIARNWFVAIHVPLFAVVIWLAFHQNKSVREKARCGLAAFSVVHALLHYRLRSDPLSAFDSPLSIALIGGAALFGAAYLLMRMRSTRAAIAV
jgi:hypothetical protein